MKRSQISTIITAFCLLVCPLARGRLSEASADAIYLNCTFSVQLQSKSVIARNSPVPRPTRQVLPEYPIGMRIQAVSGSVKLRLTIAADGTVDQINVLTAANPTFEAAAKEAVRNWKFSETLENPARAPVEVDYTFEFSIVIPD
jgi:TonB family protein